MLKTIIHISLAVTVAAAFFLAPVAVNAGVVVTDGRDTGEKCVDEHPVDAAGDAKASDTGEETAGEETLGEEAAGEETAGEDTVGEDGQLEGELGDTVGTGIDGAPLTEEEQAVFLFASAILNSHYVDLEVDTDTTVIATTDDATDETFGESGNARGALARIANVDGEYSAGGCSATSGSSLGLLLGLMLVVSGSRRRRRSS